MATSCFFYVKNGFLRWANSKRVFKRVKRSGSESQSDPESLKIAVTMAGTSAWPCHNSCLRQQSARVPAVCPPQRKFLAQPSYVRRSRQIREVRARDALDAIASVVPGAIPRPVAKGLVIFFGASFVWSLISKVIA